MRIPFVIIAASLTTSALSAQQWTAEQQSVVDDLATCWDIWMEGVESGTPDRWVNECTNGDPTFWPGAYGAPMGRVRGTGFRPGSTDRPRERAADSARSATTTTSRALPVRPRRSTARRRSGALTLGPGRRLERGREPSG